MQKRRWQIACVLLACSLWHGRTLWLAWSLIGPDSAGGDFASYYYAALEAVRGGNPYDALALNTLAGRDPKTFFSVKPYFYPPPFLLLLTWAPKLSLPESLKVWFWLNELALVGIFMQLLLWWRRLNHRLEPLYLAAVLAVAFVGSTIAVNLSLGQANLFVVLATLCGVYCAEGRRPLLGGALVGLACMAKMSPALFVMWWCVQGRWRAVAGACGTAVVSSVLALAIVDLETQLHFYTEVLPGFASGSYNGLGMPVGIMGNHSIANVYHQLLSTGQLLSPSAQACSRFTSLALLVWLGWKFRQPSEGLVRIAQVSVVGIVLIVIPIYAYEHHLVWAIPAFVAGGVAISNGLLSKRWIVPLVFSWLVWAMDPALLRETYHALREGGDGSASWAARSLAMAIQEAKFVAILIAGAAAFEVASVSETAATRESPGALNSD